MREMLIKYLHNIGKSTDEDFVQELLSAFENSLFQEVCDEAKIAVLDCLAEDPLLVVGKTIEAFMQTLTALDMSKTREGIVINSSLLAMHFAIVLMMEERQGALK